MIRHLLALAPLLVVAAVGCGGDDAGSGGGSSGPQGGAGGDGGGVGPGGTGSGATGPGGAGSGGAPVVETLHLVGRFDETEPEAPRFTWSGTSIGARVAGTSVEVDLDGAAGVFFEAIVDGAPAGVFETNGGMASYPLASGLAAGDHDIEIYRRTEGWTGVVQFRGFAAGDGALVASPSPYAHKLEFIGDSITCGYGVEGPDANCNFTTDTESAYLTYAAIAARNTAAAAHLIAYSGKGVFQNYGGGKDEPMPELYLRTLTDDPTPWDFSKWVADAVVVNLGTNDFSAPIAEGDFTGAYLALLGTVRAKYPAAMIFAVGWEHWGSDKTTWVQNALAETGDANTRYLQFTILPEDGFGCDYHPSAATHAKLGQLLTEALQAELGW